MQALLQDLRYAMRQTVKSPGFTFAAVISLALGIGATTAVFSVIYGALIHPYPYKAADRIVGLTLRSKTGDEARVLLNGPQIPESEPPGDVLTVFEDNFTFFRQAGIVRIARALAAVRERQPAMGDV